MATKCKSENIYGIKKNTAVYLFNSARHPLHPWAGIQFTWDGLRFKRLQQCLGFFKAEHFKLGKEVKQQVLECKTGWDVVKLIKDQNISTDADWSGWGRWKQENLLPILRQMAKESRRFRLELMAIQQPVIGLCTKDKSLGTGMDVLPNKKKQPELFEPSNWEGRNLLGRELVQLRTELRILAEGDEDEEAPTKRKASDADDGEVPRLKRQPTTPEMEATQPL